MNVSLLRVLCFVRRGLGDGSNTRPEGSYQVCASECDLGTSTLKSSWPTRAVEPRESITREMQGMCTSQSLALADTSPKVYNAT
jgi:hypothetical protein